ncbi:MAG: hypothetical protein JM58_08480 [Peptococcaceae bacterium BICA1-8]|nr:MAG: hypothetical protein JM58_08480 [Peptococcaceae bacterium BICA1-8]
MSKSELEKAIDRGIYGTPELKREEINNYLGCFRERVLKALTKKQIVEPGTYKEILDAIHDPRAKRLVITNDVQLSFAMDYINLAHKNNVEFTLVDGHDYSGDIGLVVVSDTAVDIENIYVN